MQDLIYQFKILPLIYFNPPNYTVFSKITIVYMYIENDDRGINNLLQSPIISNYYTMGGGGWNGGTLIYDIWFF